MMCDITLFNGCDVIIIYYEHCDIVIHIVAISMCEGLKLYEDYMTNVQNCINLMYNIEYVS